jgi:threonine/homoserine/homoserine lactone efflux protein
VKGFLINTLNPYNYLTWMGFMVFLNKINAGKTDKLIFFFFALLGMLIIDGLILINIRRANWLLKYSRQLSILNALIFIALGLKLLF